MHGCHKHGAYIISPQNVPPPQFFVACRNNQVYFLLWVWTLVRRSSHCFHLLSCFIQMKASVNVTQPLPRFRDGGLFFLNIGV
jgi:hypothetical protein